MNRGKDFWAPRRHGFDDDAPPDFEQRHRPQRSPIRPDDGFGEPAMPSMDVNASAVDATVKWFKDEKGFGFVELGNGQGDAFLHATALHAAGADSVPAGARLRVLVGAGAKGPQVTRVLSVDLHAGQIQGFFNIPVDNLYAAPVILEHLKKRFSNGDAVMVSPDAGGTERARAFAKRLGCTLAVIDKRRTGPNVAEVMHLVGDVKGKAAIILDDMIDTAGTLTQAAKALKDHGAKSIHACATHGVLSGPAMDRINESPIEEVLITDTIPLREEGSKTTKVKVLSVAELLAEAIRRIHEDESVSSLFI